MPNFIALKDDIFKGNNRKSVSRLTRKVIKIKPQRN